MLIRTIKTEGLAHLSYLIGDGGKAAVIDPRRDCACYVEMARAQELEIAWIFETHRNEDFVSGAPIKAQLTGAPVFHGPSPAAPIAYARTVREGDSFRIGGDLKISVLETPGHTDDHLAYVIHDAGYPDGAVGVFTGDALFVGDVGRTDFYPDRAAEVASLLFDSLQKLKALGDQALIYPAHGAGSVCGADMASREFSTIGHERCNNPRLKITDREAFIAAKLAETHYLPPYFATMERLNVDGAAAVPAVQSPLILPPNAIGRDTDARLVDIRSVGAFSAAHLSGALSLPVAMIPSFAGWFLDENEPLVLLADDAAQATKAAIHLHRIGFDRIQGTVINMVELAARGQSFASIAFVDHQVVDKRLRGGKPNWTLLDVRSADEVEANPMPGSSHIYIGHLRDRYRELDPSKPITVMCASGARATVAAGWLKAHGFDDLDIFLGSMGACTAHHPGKS
jgi:hydroxyacylglutathione hydrolase